MKILVGGSTGLVGSALVPILRENGHEVNRMVRSESLMSDDTVLWDPQHCELCLEHYEGQDVVINLGGENIASGWWTEEKKKKIRNSRVIGTHMLSELLAKLEKPPKVLVNASAIGYYGNRGDEIVSEESLPGEGFLAGVCRDWEAATRAAEDKGIRVVKLRIGVVLSKKGGALSRMLTPFKLGLGGVIGSGKQYFSWITLEDLLGVILHVMGDETIRGPVNATTPKAVTNRELTKALGHVLNRPTFFPLPEFVAKLLMGEMAEELLLSSTRVAPNVLTRSHYDFLYPEIEGALKHIIKGD